MSFVFNNGRGGAICDACRKMVIVGKVTVHPHTVEPDPSHEDRRKHYCDPPCDARRTEVCLDCNGSEKCPVCGGEEPDRSGCAECQESGECPTCREEAS